MTDSLYTKEVDEIIYSQRWPVVPEIRETESNLQIVFYLDEVTRLLVDDLIALRNSINYVVPRIRALGIPAIFVKIPTPRGSVDKYGNEKRV